MKIAVLALVASLLIGEDQARIEVRHQRPSKVVERMQPMVPASVKVEALDLDGFIVLRGPAKELAEARALIPLFDVRSRLVRFDYSVTSPVDKIDYTGTFTIPNNESHTFSESGTGLKLTLKPRMNEDDTITVLATYALRGKTRQVVVRIRRGEPVYLKQGVFATRREDPKLIEALKVKTDDPFVTVKADIAL